MYESEGRGRARNGWKGFGSPVERVRIRDCFIDGRLSRSSQSGMGSGVTVHGTVTAGRPLVMVQPAKVGEIDRVERMRNPLEPIEREGELFDSNSISSSRVSETCRLTFARSCWVDPAPSRPCCSFVYWWNSGAAAPRRRPVGTVAEFGFAVGPLIAAVARKLAGSCIDSSGFVARIDSATSERGSRG